MENELFEKAPIHKAYLSLALPVVFSMVISLGAPIFTFMIALGDIFGLGGSSVISRLFGQKKDQDGKHLLGRILCVVHFEKKPAAVGCSGWFSYNKRGSRAGIGDRNPGVRHKFYAELWDRPYEPLSAPLWK